jgi:hypothetical protein
MAFLDQHHISREGTLLCISCDCPIEQHAVSQDGPHCTDDCDCGRANNPSHPMYTAYH